MNREEFKRICENTSSFLSRRYVPLAWYALPLFFPMTAHPGDSIKYDELKLEQRHPWLRGAKNGLSALKDRVKNRNRAYTLSSFWNGLHREAVSTVLFSWLVDRSHLERESDFYLGGMAGTIARSGRSLLQILGNASSSPTPDVVSHPAVSGTERRMMPEYLGVCREAWIYLLSLWGAFVLILTPAAPDSRALKRTAVRQLLQGYAVPSLRFYFFFRLLLRRTGADLFVTLYEGYSWERCVWYAARRASPKILRIGYQHAVLREGAFSIGHIPRKNYAFAPDRILTTGPMQAQKLAGATGIPCSVYGSARQTAVKNLHPRSLPRRVLVLPEGILSECAVLAEFAHRCAREMPDVEFVIRLHPIMNPARVEESLGFKLEGAGTQLSRARDLQEELASCGFVLYRGTTSAVHALTSGLRIIYLGLPGEMSVDPLAGLRDYKSTVHNPAEMREALSRACDEAEWQRAAAYSRTISQPVDETVIESICNTRSLK